MKAWSLVLTISSRMMPRLTLLRRDVIADLGAAERETAANLLALERARAWIAVSRMVTPREVK